MPKSDNFNLGRIIFTNESLEFAQSCNQLYLFWTWRLIQRAVGSAKTQQQKQLQEIFSTRKHKYFSYSHVKNHLMSTLPTEDLNLRILLIVKSAKTVIEIRETKRRFGSVKRLEKSGN